MVLSPYVKAYPHPDKPGALLVIGMRKASVCLLPEALFRRLEQGDIPPEAVGTLTRLGVLVADAEAERAEARRTLEGLNRLGTGLSVSVFLGMECNFRCAYCYEGTLKGRDRMTESTAAQLVEFIKGRFLPGTTELIFDFYGGEPLLYTERIAQIADPLRKLAGERNAKWSFTLVTNGSLLTKEVTSRLVSLGLKAAKVTLDGPRENHDRFRPLRSGRGSFDAIVRNLKESTPLIRVGLGGSYTRDNFRLFPALLDHLLREGLGPDRIAQVNFGPVLQTTDAHAPEGFCGGCSSVNEPWIAEASVYLREEVLKRGYQAPKIAPTPCMVDLDATFVVDWDGTLAKCPGWVGNRKLAVGNVTEGFTNYTELLELDRLKRETECGECEYLPLCFGGCRYMKYQREGNMAGVECQRSFLDATLGAHLLADARFRARPG